MKKINIKGKGKIIFTFFILAFVTVGFLLNLKILKEPLDNFKEDKIKFGEFVKQTQDGYKTEIENKNEFINLNGLFARVTGRNHYNNVTRLKNGMLTYGEVAGMDMTSYSKGISDFSSHLSKNGVDYIYVMAPIKADLEGKLLYEGTNNYGNQNADMLLRGLAENNVNYIDLRPHFSATSEQIEKYFYKTDHHWQTNGAFEAFGIVLDNLNKKYPDANIDMSLADVENWNITEYEKCFLGSHGKRVGTLYAGIDDFLLYTPKFDTSMSMYIPKHKLYYEGTFEETVVVGKKYLENKDLFNENPYCAYIGGDYPIVQHRNSLAQSDLKVLIIKDSFSLPFQSFMATAFKEVDVVDPRHLTECTVAEYVAISNPDIVITLMNPSVFDIDKYYKTGNEKADYHNNHTEEKVIFERSEFSITAKAENMYAYGMLRGKCDFNTKYKISFDDVEFLSGDAECITVALYNATKKQFVSNYAFDIDYCRENGSFEWTSLTPETNSGDNIQILIYAGRHSQTGGNSVRFTNLKVVEYK